jgi:hypothetical protein
MREEQEPLRKLILEAVSNDYEQFESIVSQIRDWQEILGIELDFDPVEQLLMDSIAAREIGAYLLFPDPPHFVPTEVTEDTLFKSWFFLTGLGRERLRRFEQQDSSLPM